METVVRTIVVYLFILVGLRILGKREFGELSALDLVTLLLVPELVSQALTREDDSLTNAFVATATLFTLVFLTSALSHRFKRVEHFVNSKPTVLVARGQILVDNCNRERISAEEIVSEMHKNGIDEIEHVRWAILEVDGRISIVPDT
ncbi:MAG TPA: YetF domain-containing protein [Opitutaceae bacterium]